MARAPSAFQSEGRHRVAVLALDSVVPFDLGVVCQVFGSWHPDLGATRYDLALCGTAAGPVRTANGISPEAPHDLDPLARLCLHLVRRDRHHFARVPRSSARAYHAAFRGHASERSGVGDVPARAPAT